MPLAVPSAHRPAVHQLCHGAFIQEPLHLRNSVSAFPLQPLAFDAEASYAARYASEALGATVDETAFNNMKREGAQARPVVALVARLAIDAPPEQLESVARVDLTNAASVIGWVAGEVPEPFAVVTATLREVYFRIAPPQARRRFRLGFGNTGADYYAQIYRIVKLADEDERFAFVLSLYKDALREANAEFRVARFFACLEALAYRLKKDRGSRDAVRALLGLEPGALATIAVDGVNYRFDRVELGGRIRDKLFHGVPFDPKELTDEARFAYNYFRGHPEYFRDLLHVDCELEIARWANHASRGQISDGVAAV